MKFTPKSSFNGLSKVEMAKTLQNPHYSGKTVRDQDGNILRGPGFYHN